MWRWIVPILFAMPVQAETLADVQRDVDNLLSDLSAMKLELMLSEDQTPAFTGSLLERIAGLEEELQRMVATTEMLEFRIRGLTNRAGGELQDILFRLCELDPECDDPAQPRPFGDPSQGSGGVDPVRVAPPAKGQAEFDAANDLFVAGDTEGALSAIRAFQANHKESPLLQRAYLMEGSIQRDLGQTEDAARSFLTAYVENPTGNVAPDALYQLALTFHGLDRPDEACLALVEVEGQFPDSPVVPDANEAVAEFGCE